MNQYSIDVLRFSDLLSKYTGISKTKIDSYLSNENINNIFEHPTSVCTTKTQVTKLEELRELRNLYNSLKEGVDNQYIMNSSTRAGEYIKEYFYDIKDKEKFVCSFLNAQNQIITTKVLFTGTISEAPIYPREIAKEALMYDANSVILSHNHPGGSCKPSNADIEATNKICSALSTLNIKVMDHIIAAGDNYYSLAEHGLISQSFSDISVKDKIMEQYKINNPEIKYISENTANIINSLNSQKGAIVSINEIKNAYKETGKRLELSDSTADLEDFKLLNEVVDDLKRSKLIMHQKQTNEKITQNQILKNKDIEMV